MSVISRTPFELSTTYRCASLALLQAVGATCSTFTVSSAPILLIAFKIYPKACCLEIESLLAELDFLSTKQSKKAELLMVNLFKEIIDLHRKVIRYVLHMEMAIPPADVQHPKSLHTFGASLTPGCFLLQLSTRNRQSA